jgi:tRNA/rRNA methyltransferase
MTDAPAIILSKPQLGENIGAAARAMKNFGLTDLRLVAPRDGWPNKKAEAMAAGAIDIIRAAQVYEDLGTAIGELELVLATTARDRGTPKETLTPAIAAARLSKAVLRGEKTGILFGNERAGLDNDELSLAEAVITIPTAFFASLNLGQAVLILAWEWFRLADATPPSRIEHSPIHRKPTRAEMQGLFAHLEEALTESGFLYPPDKRQAMIRATRAMLHRAKLTYQEVQTIRGMIAALAKGKHRGPKS